MLRLAKILSVLLILYSPVNFAEWEISNPEYNAIFEIADRIYRPYPSDQYVVIGVGRSPSLPMAFLQNLQSDYAYNFPISAFKYRVSGNTPAKIPEYAIKQFSPLSDNQKQKLFAHFDRFFPSAKQINRREIVLFDYSRRGGNLFALEEYLREYLVKNVRFSKIHLVTLAARQDQDVILKYAAETNHFVDFITLDLGLLFDESLDRSYYDKYSEFGQFFIEPQSNAQPLLESSSPEYIRIKSVLREIMQKDSRVANLSSSNHPFSRYPLWAQIQAGTTMSEAILFPFDKFKSALDSLLEDTSLIIDATDRTKVGFLYSKAVDAGVDPWFLNQVGFIEIPSSHSFHGVLIELIKSSLLRFPGDKIFIRRDDWHRLKPEMMKMWMALDPAFNISKTQSEFEYFESKYVDQISFHNVAFKMELKNLISIGPTARCSYLLSILKL
jgi:hypothetical protein